MTALKIMFEADGVLWVLMPRSHRDTVWRCEACDQVIQTGQLVCFTTLRHENDIFHAGCFPFPMPPEAAAARYDDEVLLAEYDHAPE